MSFRDKISRGIDLARLGTDFLRLRSGDAKNRVEASRALAAHMGSLRGLPQKVGQLLSLTTLDSEKAAPENSFAPLTAAGHAVPVSEFCEWVLGSLGTDRYRQFQSFESKGFAASIGQVHRAELTTGEVVAVKAQYPGIAEALAVDLAALGLLLAPLAFKAKGAVGLDIDMREYRAAIGAGIAEELDYESERAALERGVSRMAEVGGIVVPRPVPDLCSSSVLTMSWISGQRLEEILAIDLSRREQVGRILLRWFLRSWLVWGELHADPHPGNYRYQVDTSEVRVGILDFGCRYCLGAKELSALRGIPAKMENLDPEQALEFFEALGFKTPLLSPLKSKLPGILKLVWLPFSSPGNFKAQEWHLAERLQDLLGEDRWNFRLAGPASLTYFIRSFSGLLHQLGALGVSLNWRAELEKLDRTPTSERTVVAARPKSDAAILEAVARAESYETELQILVEENGELKARVTLPAASVERLEELIPDDVLGKLREQGIDAASMGLLAFQQGCKPQQLFGISDGGKIIRVWLEQRID